MYPAAIKNNILYRLQDYIVYTLLNIWVFTLNIEMKIENLNLVSIPVDD